MNLGRELFGLDVDERLRELWDELGGLPAELEREHEGVAHVIGCAIRAAYLKGYADGIEEGRDLEEDELSALTARFLERMAEAG